MQQIDVFLVDNSDASRVTPRMDEKRWIYIWVKIENSNESYSLHLHISHRTAEHRVIDSTPQESSE